MFSKKDEDTDVRIPVGPGDRIGLVASTHGDWTAYGRLLDHLDAMGVGWILHAGDIMGEETDPTRCLLAATEPPRRFAVLGNHDVLIMGTETIHEYPDDLIEGAERMRKILRSNNEAWRRMQGLKTRVVTPHFIIVHESVEPPYFAKRSKRRRKSHGWEIGSAADENTEGVCHGRIDLPHFIGSDHTSYIIRPHPGTGFRIDRPGPGDRVKVPRRSVVSLPSAAYSRDDRYVTGFAVAEILEDGSVMIEFGNLD